MPRFLFKFEFFLPLFLSLVLYECDTILGIGDKIRKKNSGILGIYSIKLSIQNIFFGASA